MKKSSVGLIGGRQHSRKIMPPVEKESSKQLMLEPQPSPSVLILPLPLISLHKTPSLPKVYGLTNCATCFELIISRLQ